MSDDRRPGLHIHHDGAMTLRDTAGKTVWHLPAPQRDETPPPPLECDQEIERLRDRVDRDRPARYGIDEIRALISGQWQRIETVEARIADALKLDQTKVRVRATTRGDQPVLRIDVVVNIPWAVEHAGPTRYPVPGEWAPYAIEWADHEHQ